MVRALDSWAMAKALMAALLSPVTIHKKMAERTRMCRVLSTIFNLTKQKT